MAAADLLWIDCSEPKSAKRHEVAAAARQHVMLNYIAKQQPAQSDKARDANRQLSTSPPEDDDDLDNSTTPPHRHKRSSPHRPSHALKGKGTRLKRGIPLSSHTKIPLTTTLKPALLHPQDKEIYQAAWWHSLNICTTDPTHGWIDICRNQWGQGFWEFAREDSTLREIFLSYAAAKEASVKSLSDSRAYFVHKGRAMRLVSEDLKREGKGLRIAAVATICLLAKATFIEEEFEAGEAHVRAIKAVVEGRGVGEMPSFLWLFVIWADLRLTGVLSRAPTLPYALHPDFEGVVLPRGMRERAEGLARGCLEALPLKRSVLGPERMELLVRKLHELAIAYNDPTETNWPPVWVTTYDAAWMLADMRHIVRASFSTSPPTSIFPYNCEHILLLASSIQMWSTVSQFVPQPGFLRYALDEITSAISHLDPETLSSRWTSSSGNASSLLFVLFNASAAFIKLCFTSHLSASSLPHWLWRDLQHTCILFSIRTSKEFEAILRKFPYAKNWNGRMCGVVWLWLKTGFVVPNGDGGGGCERDGIRGKRRRRAFFASFRLTFDREVDERMRGVEGERERELLGRAFETALVGR